MSKLAPVATGLNLPTNFGEAAANGKPEKAVAQLWLNIGYTVKSAVAGEEDKFVSLPLGIALDTQPHLATNTKNESFARLQQARNGLLDQLIELGATLKPGESKILAMGQNGLSIQLRRISADAPELPADGNPFAVKLAF